MYEQHNCRHTFRMLSKDDDTHGMPMRVTPRITISICTEMPQFVLFTKHKSKRYPRIIHTLFRLYAFAIYGNHNLNPHHPPIHPPIKRESRSIAIQ